MNKKLISSAAAVILAVSIMVGGYLSEDNGTVQSSNSVQSSQTSSQQENSSQDTSHKVPPVQDTVGKDNTNTEKIEFPYELVEVSQIEGIEPFGYINAKVIKVTDGDTLTVSYNNQEFKVRMLDVDTPESVKSGVPAQPYSKEASDFTKETLTNKNIRLIFEKGTTDQYGRLLAHIVLEDGTFYNATLIRKGYAISVFYSPNTLLKKYYADLQDKAIADKAGFWSLPEDERPFVLDSKGKYVASYKLQDKAA